MCASNALEVIDHADIPLLIAPGNHDYDIPIVSSVKKVEEREKRSLQMFNAYFGVKRFLHKPWFGGVYEQGKAENMYAYLDDYLIVILEFGPRDEVLEWANKIMGENDHKKVIVITHCYLYIDGKRTSKGDDADPKKYVATKDDNNGKIFGKN